MSGVEPDVAPSSVRVPSGPTREEEERCLGLSGPSVVLVDTAGRWSIFGAKIQVKRQEKNTTTIVALHGARESKHSLT